MDKYELTSETLQYAGHTLHRIKALRDFGIINTGELGGWIESEKNLSQVDNAWVYGDAIIYGEAEVSGNATIWGRARVFDKALVYDNADIFNDAIVCGYADVNGEAKIRNAKVCDIKDYIVFKNFWSSGRYFTWTRSNNKWSVGCFYRSAEELIKKAYADSEKSGREYERVVRYVESILADEKKETSN